MWHGMEVMGSIQAAEKMEHYNAGKLFLS